MKQTLAKILNYAPLVGVILFISLAVFIFSGRADAKYKPSPAATEMSKVIKANQRRVSTIDSIINDLNAERNSLVQTAKTFRETICNTEKEACTKEYLDPMNSGVDLSVFIIPSPES